MTPDAHMVETLRLRTAALHRVSRSNDQLRRENILLRARLAGPLRRLGGLIETIESECDTTEPVCHEHDVTDEGECALAADLETIRTSLAAALDGSHDA